MKNNMDIRLEAKKKGVAFWQIAQKLEVSEWTFTRWLRYDLEPVKKERILMAIDAVAEELYGRK